MMANNPRTSVWANEFSDEDDADTSRLIDKNGTNQYQSIQRTIQDHEEGLNKLGEAIKRQKYVATELATEVDLQNEILEDIDTGLTRTDDNLQKNTRNIKLVLKKSSTCGLWVLIVILAAVITGLAIF